MPERADHDLRPPLVTVMGVSGSGKTTIGLALADRLGLEYADADKFHSKANVAKMSAGQPLDDDDRAPWLASIGRWLADREDVGAVVSCSALRRRYRDVLREAAPGTRFLHLDGDAAVILDRMSHRPGHFMPPSLLESQIDTLERLEPDEPGAALDLATPIDQLVDAFVTTLPRESGDRS